MTMRTAPRLPLAQHVAAQRLDLRMMDGADCEDVVELEWCAAVPDGDQMVAVEDRGAGTAEQAADRAAVTVARPCARAERRPSGG